MRRPVRIGFSLLAAGFLCVTLASPALRSSYSAGSGIELFNGKDLTNFYTWLVDSKYQDPDGVFTVVDQIDGTMCSVFAASRTSRSLEDSGTASRQYARETESPT